ncbi:cytochrome P450 [Faunimonas sp. B44]|uniref:cytochrome P450 n=1 Tax=Faunimonas sp. B44 TaxID=3461493 RepID=UPI004044A298
MPPFPREAGFDSTLALMREGYRFIPNRCRRLGSDAFETRLMLRKAVCISGPEAAEMFYGGERFTRVGAMPNRVLALLQDRGSVQTLDGNAHRHRKAMFLAMMEPDARRRLCAVVERRWRERVAAAGPQEIMLFAMVREVLTGAVCEWAGVRVAEDEVPAATARFGAMIDNVSTFGPKHWRARLLRIRTERWIRREIERIRSRGPSGKDDAAHRIAWHRGPDGNLLDTATAAVELINVLRPTVANARFIVWSALALHQHPEWRDRFASGDETDLDGFVQEVRRLSPFFPFVGGRVREPFDWRGRRFAKGEWVLLDLYGTNRDGRSFSDPDQFDPARFRQSQPTAFDLVPQGGGHHETSHRCPGEWLTIDLMKTAIRLLTRQMHYTVPPQDLSVALDRVPALPKSGFVMANVRLRPDAGPDQAAGPRSRP